jgi:hypothetical protein
LKMNMNNIYHRKLLASRGILFNGGGGGAGDPAAVAAAKATADAEAARLAALASEDDNEDDDNVKDIEKLRRRMSGYRLKAKEFEGKLTAETANRDAAIKAATEATTVAINKAADERLLRSEVRAALKAADIIDAGDAMKLLDLSALKLSENGEVEGLDDLIKKAKEGKAYLFKAVTTSHNGKPPRQSDASAKTAKEMTDAEADAELAQLLKRR